MLLPLASMIFNSWVPGFPGRSSQSEAMQPFGRVQGELSFEYSGATGVGGPLPSRRQTCSPFQLDSKMIALSGA